MTRSLSHENKQSHHSNPNNPIFHPNPNPTIHTRSNKQSSHAKGFTITTGHPLLKTYSSPSTDSGTPLTRNFCGDCGSSLFAFTDLYPDIVGLAAATLDGGFERWRPGVEQ